MDKTDLRDDIRIKTPDIHPTAFIADGAKVIGDVILNRNSSIWYNTVVRADINSIVIGERSNIQDNSYDSDDDTQHPNGQRMECNQQ